MILLKIGGENTLDTKSCTAIIDIAFHSVKLLGSSSKAKDIKEPEGLAANKRELIEMFAHVCFYFHLFSN
jgi:hypothetical protein